MVTKIHTFDQKPTTVEEQSIVKKLQGVSDFLRNRTIFILRTVFEVHQHVDL